MSMVIFRGASINSANLIGFEFGRPTIKRDGKNGIVFTATASPSQCLMIFPGQTTIPVSGVATQPIVFNCTISDMPDKHDFPSLHDFVKAQVQYIDDNLMKIWGQERLRLLEQVNSEWNELLKQQRGAS